jgi:alpha-tubulin suppressor-like RCC1 family protein
VAPGIDWSPISAAGHHTCARASDDSLWCWGDNDAGQLGVGDTMARSVPTQVGIDNVWREISTGKVHTCSIRVDKSLWCWGGNKHGQLGLGDTKKRTTPQPV